MDIGKQPFSSAARERREQEKIQQNDEKSENEKNESSAEEVSKKNHLELGFDDDEHGLSKSNSGDTSLLVYFFGRRGDAELCFEDFRSVMCLETVSKKKWTGQKLGY